MDTKETKTLCLKQVYGAALTDAERARVDDYAQTADGRAYLRECQEVKDLLKRRSQQGMTIFMCFKHTFY